ncbi:MAG TPA: hypothetical protein VIH11_10060 [Gemmatimonadaceae bacterium]
MSAQRTLPPGRAGLTLALVAVAIAAAAASYFAGKRAGGTHEIMAASPGGVQRIALVREAPCGGGTCQSLWMGSSREDAKQIASLVPGVERCEEIAWASDGFRVGFVVNGYQLRIFDGESGEAVGQVNLLQPEGTPSSRIARGVTFSQNGAAVTFDDCPRARSGCRSAMAAVR